MAQEKMVSYSGTRIEKFDTSMKLVDIHDSQSKDSKEESTETKSK